MKPAVQKISLFFLSLAVLLTSTLGQFAAAPIKAQTPPVVCDVTNLYCGSVVCGSEAAPTEIAGTIGSVNECITLVRYVYIALFATPVPQPWYSQDVFQFGQKVFDPTNTDEIFGERYTYAQVNWILNSLVNMFCPICHAQNPVDMFNIIIDLIHLWQGVIDFTLAYGGTDTTTQNTAILLKYGIVGQTYALMVNIPSLIFTDDIASGVNEVKYVAGKFNIAAPAYAQGLGYDKLGLGTVKGLWVATRNMAYLIAVVLLIVAGFMLIFKTKISANTSVTLQQIIPRLITSIFLVTFSFAIAGFVIDMIYVVITAVLGFLYFSTSVTGVSVFPDYAHFQTAISVLTGSTFNFVTAILGKYIGWMLILVLATAIAPIATLVLTPMAVATGGPVAVLLVGLIAPAIGLLLGLVLWSIYVWARILGQMIVAYVSLILLVIAGPIMIIMDILPTSPGGFKKWIMCVIGNASVFASYALFAIVVNMLFTFARNSDLGFTPRAGTSIINSQFTLPGFMGSWPQRGFIIRFFIVIGFFSIVPNIVSSIQNMFCKTSDLSGFLERSVKESTGHVTGDAKAIGTATSDSIKNRASTKTEGKALEPG